MQQDNNHNFEQEFQELMKSMSPEEREAAVEKLVTIEFQKEYDLLEDKWEDRVFVKLYVAARTSGLLATISDRDWKTLCALATFMDAEGNCYPSQAQIAKALGVERETANRRVQGLLNFRFKDKPVVLVEKSRISTEFGERWTNNRYKILPISNLKIFDNSQVTSSVTKSSHRPMCRFPNTGNRHTNKNHSKQDISKNVNVNEDKKIWLRDEEYAKALAREMQDTKSLGWYRRVVEKCDEAGQRGIIQRTRGEVLELAESGNIKKSKGALFTQLIKQYATERGIDLTLTE